MVISLFIIGFIQRYFSSWVDFGIVFIMPLVYQESAICVYTLPESIDIVGNWVGSLGNDYCDIDWTHLSASCEFPDLDYYPKAEGGGFGISGPDIRNSFDWNYIWLENTSENRKKNPPLPGDIITNSHHTMIVKDVSYSEDGKLQVEQISGNVGTDSFPNCNEEDRDGCIISDGALPGFEDGIWGWGRVFTRGGTGQFYNPEPNFPDIYSPKLSFSEDGIKFKGFYTKISRTGFTMDKKFQDTFFPYVKLSSNYVVGFDGDQDSYGRGIGKRYYNKAKNASEAVTHKDTFSNPLLGRLEILRPDRSAANTSLMYLSDVKIVSFDGPVFGRYDNSQGSSAMCQNNGGLLREYDKKFINLNSISGSISLQNVWLEDYKIQVNVYVENGCCDDDVQIEIGSFLTDNTYDVKVLNEQITTQNFDIPINEVINYVAGAGYSLVFEIAILDSTNKSTVIHVQSYELEPEREDGEVLCGKTSNFDQTGFQEDDLIKEIGNRLYFGGEMFGGVIEKDTMMIDPRGMIEITTPDCEISPGEAMITSLRIDEIGFLPGSFDDISFYKIGSFDSETGNYGYANNLLFYNSSESINIDDFGSINNGIITTIDMTKSIDPSTGVVFVNSNTINASAFEAAYQDLMNNLNMQGSGFNVN